MHFTTAINFFVLFTMISYGVSVFLTKENLKRFDDVIVSYKEVGPTVAYFFLSFCYFCALGNEIESSISLCKRD